MEKVDTKVELLRQFHVYSSPGRDPRFHTIATVFITRVTGTPITADDAIEAGIFTKESLPHEIAFDHRKILYDYFYNRY